MVLNFIITHPPSALIKAVFAASSKSIVELVRQYIPFAAEVLKLLIKENKISQAVAEGMKQWEHSGFHIYCSEPVTAYEEEAIERLSRYIVRAPLSQERMNYIS
ncbi:MAG: transposase, partial [Ruminiclostridium sp.]